MSLPSQQLTPTEDPCEKFQKQYQANLAYFEKRHPSLYQFALSHRPKEKTLGITDSGHPALLTIEGGQQLTAEDPEERTKQYLANFMHSPDYLTYGLRKFNRNANQSKTHLARFLQQLNDAVPQGQSDCEITEQTPIPLAICFGQQLGHITTLAPDAYDIRHLVIYEPDLDEFYASLFVQDYGELSAPFEADYKSITFVVGDSPERLCNAIYDLVQRSGYFLLAYTLLFEPTETDQTRLAKKRYQQLAHRMIQGWGYFTDELRSLRQTLMNARSGLTLFTANRSQKNKLATLPCCVVGNGPSLDICLPFLKAHQNNVLIFSAGTTLHTLLKHGITPDFQVEIERAHATYKHLEPLTKDHPISNIPLVTLNTILPKARKLFSQVYTFLKEGDLGSEMLIENHITPNITLPFTHPLVGNGATAIATRLGCQQIFLMGMDLATSKTGQVHSTGSVYDDPNFDFNDKKRRFNYKTQGNLGDTVFTDQLFDSSRLSLELLINEHPEHQFYNIGSGIRITGAAPLDSPEAIAPAPTTDKASLLQEALNHTEQITLQEPTINKLKAQTQTETHATLQKLKALLWPKHTSQLDEVITCFSQQRSLLEYSKNGSPAPFRLLKGSLAHLQTQILYNALFTANKHERIQFLGAARKTFIKYIRFIENHMKEQLG